MPQNTRDRLIFSQIQTKLGANSQPLLQKTSFFVRFVGMKKEIHPTYYPTAEVVCACGNKFKIGSTLKNIEVEICSACHPFFTGEEKIIDTGGRVERFKRRKEAAAKAIPKAKVAKKSEKPSKVEKTKKEN